MNRGSFIFGILLCSVTCCISPDKNSYESIIASDSTNLLTANWQISPFSQSPKLISTDSSSALKLPGSVSDPNYIYQEVKVVSGEFYLLAVDVNRYTGSWVNMGIAVTGQGHELGYHYLQNPEYLQPKRLSIRFKANNNLVKVKVGFRKPGNSYAEISNISLVKVSRIPTIFDSPFASYLNEHLNLSEFDSINYHKNILTVTRYVNTHLISSLRKYYDHPGNANEKQLYLQLEESKRTSFSQHLKSLLPNSHFVDYSELPILQSSKAYCQKSSLSMHDVLNEFGIPANQLHMAENGTGFHQFLEYWHPFLMKWIMVDPFYGITYVDNTGDLIGYDELVGLVNNRAVTIDNVKHEDIERFYFDLDELSKGWSAEIKNVYFHDMRKSFAH